MWRLLFLARLQKKTKRKTTSEVKSNQMNEEQLKIIKSIVALNKIVDKLEQRISTLEKVIGKVQLRLGDVVLYIDKKGEQNG